jgi:DNA-binding transcriptional ArsR family regulator
MSQTGASTTSAQKRKPAVAVRLLRGLANERRLRVLYRLSSSKHSELDVTQLTAQSGLTQSALSQHLAKMRACGMLVVRRSGPRRLYRIASSDELWRILAGLGGYMRPKRDG